MTKLEKAYLKYSNGIWENKKFISKENFIKEYCPYNLQVGEEDYDWDNDTSSNVKAKGCRGITCEQCWNKEIDK